MNHISLVYILQRKQPSLKRNEDQSNERDNRTNMQRSGGFGDDGACVERICTIARRRTASQGELRRTNDDQRRVPTERQRRMTSNRSPPGAYCVTTNYGRTHPFNIDRNATEYDTWRRSSSKYDTNPIFLRAVNEKRNEMIHQSTMLG
jgi:hypothetical protein